MHAPLTEVLSSVAASLAVNEVAERAPTYPSTPPRTYRHDPPIDAPERYAFADGTSRYEIVAPHFFQSSRSSQVLGWYIISGS